MHIPLHAAGAISDPSSIFNAYADLLALRKKIKSLVYGDLTPLTETGDVLAFERGAWQEHPALRVVLNWSSQSQPWPIAAPVESQIAFTNYPAGPTETLRPWEAVIFRLE